MTSNQRNVCRVCLSKVDHINNIFTEKCSTGRIYSDLLMECAEIKVIEKDTLPSQICKSCISHLESYIICNKVDEDFISKCTQIQTYLNTGVYNDSIHTEIQNLNNTSELREFEFHDPELTLNNLVVKNESKHIKTEEIEIKTDTDEPFFQNTAKKYSNDDCDVVVSKNIRVSLDQRKVMLTYMQDHPALVKGKFTGPDGARKRIALWQELANILNAMPWGATKSPDKWQKSWQDWRSDVKAKAARLVRDTAKIGGPAPAQLTQLEDQLLFFMGKEAVQGTNIPDTPEVTLNKDVSWVDGNIIDIKHTYASSNITTHSSSTFAPPSTFVPLSGSYIHSTIPDDNISPPPFSPYVPSPTSTASGPPRTFQPKNRRRRRRTTDGDEEDRFLVATELQAANLGRLADAFERLVDIGTSLLERLGNQ